EHARLQAIVARYERDLAPSKKEYEALLAKLNDRVLAKRQKILAPLKSGLAEAEHGREKATQAWRVPVLQFLVSWVSEVRSGEAAKQVKPDEQHQYEELKARVTQLDVRKRLAHSLGVKENPAKVPLTQVLRQGDYRKPADEVQPGIPSLFDPANVT